MIITTIVIHCADSDNPDHDDISVIDKWHRERGWDSVGYHFFIKKNGVRQVGRPIGTVGAHVEGHNSHTIGICMSGGKYFTANQASALMALLNELLDHPLLRSTVKGIVPHYAFNPHKTCPNFEWSLILKHSPAIGRLLHGWNE